MNARMLREPQVRYSTAFMVSRYYINRYAAIGDARQWLEGLPHDAARRTRSVEYIATVYDQVDFARKRRLQSGRVVRKEVVSTSPSIDARVDRQVEAKVRISQQEDPDDVAHA